MSLYLHPSQHLSCFVAEYEEFLCFLVLLKISNPYSGLFQVLTWLWFQISLLCWLFQHQMQRKPKEKRPDVWISCNKKLPSPEISRKNVSDGAAAELLPSSVPQGEIKEPLACQAQFKLSHVSLHPPQSSSVGWSCTPAAVFQFDLSCYSCQKIDLGNKFRRSWYGSGNKSSVSFLLYYFHIWGSVGRRKLSWGEGGKGVGKICIMHRGAGQMQLNFWGLFMPEPSILFNRKDIFPHNMVCGHFLPFKQVQFIEKLP